MDKTAKYKSHKANNDGNAVPHGGTTDRGEHHCLGASPSRNSTADNEYQYLGESPLTGLRKILVLHTHGT